MSVQVPTTEEFDELAVRVSALEQAPSSDCCDDLAQAVESTALQIAAQGAAVTGVAQLAQQALEASQAATSAVDGATQAAAAANVAVSELDQRLTTAGDTVAAQASEIDALAGRTTTMETDVGVLSSRTTVLTDRVTNLEGAPQGVAPRTWEVVVQGYTDAAVAAAVSVVLSGRSGNAVQRKLIFPPGTYNLTKPILTSTDDNHTMIEGLTVEGLGVRSTVINWNPATPGPMIKAVRRFRFFTMQGFTVRSTNPANEFAYLVSDTSGGYNQAWTFRNMEWGGSWLRVVGLDGGSTANLNSEFVFDRCFTQTDSVFADAFLRSGGITGTYNQQNQFLNYTVRDCAFTVKSGTMFRFDKGGSITVQGGSWSAANNTDGPVTWFLMPNSNSNNRSACQLHVDRVRFEPKRSDHVVIDCRWGTGSVEFSNCCDLSSLQGDPATVNAYGLHRYTAQLPWGTGVGGTLPSVRYVNHQGVGHHEVAGVASPVGRGGLLYDGCYFYRGTGGQKAPAADGSSAAALRWSNGAPRVEFTRCDNVDDFKLWS